jgi:hypothetical protein
MQDSSLPQQLLYCLVVAILVLSSARLLARNDVEPDLWGHVCYGQDMLAQGRIPPTATHTFTASGHPWINIYILAELAFAIQYQYLGVPGLLLLKLVIGIAVLGLMALLARTHRVTSLAFWVLMLLISSNLTFFL